MGTINIRMQGSFPFKDETFYAVDHGHAHAVAEAIRFLSEEVLPEAINRDHQLHDEGAYPRLGFKREDI